MNTGKQANLGIVVVHAADGSGKAMLYRLSGGGDIVQTNRFVFDGNQLQIWDTATRGNTTLHKVYQSMPYYVKSTDVSSSAYSSAEGMVGEKMITLIYKKSAPNIKSIPTEKTFPASAFVKGKDGKWGVKQEITSTSKIGIGLRMPSMKSTQSVTTSLQPVAKGNEPSYYAVKGHENEDINIALDKIILSAEPEELPTGYVKGGVNAKGAISVAPILIFIGVTAGLIFGLSYFQASLNNPSVAAPASSPTPAPVAASPVQAI